MKNLIEIEVIEDETIITLKRKDEIIGKASYNIIYIDYFIEEEIEYLKSFVDNKEKNSLVSLSKEIENKEQVFYLNNIEINKKYKEQGNGKYLLNEILKNLLKEMNPKDIIYLNCSPTGTPNEKIPLQKLESFYNSFGFESFLDQGNNKMMIIKNTKKIKLLKNKRKRRVKGRNICKKI